MVALIRVLFKGKRSVKIVHDNPFCLRPCFIQCLHYLFRQRSFLQLNQVLLQVLLAARPNDDCIAQLRIQFRVVHHPPQRALRLRQRKLPSRRTNDIERIKHRLVPIPRPIKLALLSLPIKPRPLLHLPLITAPIPRREIPTRKRVVRIKRHAITSQASQQLRLDGPVNRIVHALVHHRPHPPVPDAQLVDVRHLPRHVVAQPKPPEQPFPIQRVHRRERLFVRRRSVRRVQVPQVDLLRLQRLQRRQQVFPQAVGRVRARRAGHLAAVGVVLGRHDEPARLPVEVAQVRLGGPLAVDAGGVDFAVTVRLEDIEERGGVLEVVDAGLLDSWGWGVSDWDFLRVCWECGEGWLTGLANGHGAEDDVELGICCRHLVCC